MLVVCLSKRRINTKVWGKLQFRPYSFIYVWRFKSLSFIVVITNRVNFVTIIVCCRKHTRAQALKASSENTSGIIMISVPGIEAVVALSGNPVLNFIKLAYKGISGRLCIV